MQEKAVIDRLVDGRYAVLLVGDEEREVILPIDQLPGGAVPGMWTQVEMDGNAITKITVDPEEMERVQWRIADKMARLRGRGGRLKRDGE